jgi:hypothetical protein
MRRIKQRDVLRECNKSEALSILIKVAAPIREILADSL